MTPASIEHVLIPPLGLAGELRRPPRPKGLVIFAHGSGSSRLSPRNQQVAASLTETGFATLLFDLLTHGEARTRTNVFDIDLLAQRLIQALDWAAARRDLASLPVGLFGASTGAAAALTAAAQRPRKVDAVVSRGGRPDLAGTALPKVVAPTLLIVGGDDEPVLSWNIEAARSLGGQRCVEIIEGATHLFEEPGAMREVVHLATDWFETHLSDQPADATSGA